MSTVTLSQVKADLRITHNDDDTLLNILIDAAEDEAMQFLNVSELPMTATSSEQLAPSVYAAVFLLVRSKYDATMGEEIQKLRSCAEQLLMPYRTEVGV